MADTPAHHVDRVLPEEVPVRPWVLSLPFALRFHPHPPPDDAEVERVARQVARRLARLLRASGARRVFVQAASSADRICCPEYQPCFLRSGDTTRCPAGAAVWMTSRRT
jgi:hypothetical protein